MSQLITMYKVVKSMEVARLSLAPSLASLEGCSGRLAATMASELVTFNVSGKAWRVGGRGPFCFSSLLG